MTRRGISTFVASLLLMVLAVCAGVVMYAYTMGYLNGFNGPQINYNITEINGPIVGYQYVFEEPFYHSFVIVNDTVKGFVLVEVPSQFTITPILGDFVSAKILGFGSLNEVVYFDLRRMPK
jgi:hypothetical protein